LNVFAGLRLDRQEPVEERATAGAIMTEEPNHEQHSRQSGTTAPLRLGIDLVLTSEIAKQQGVNPTTVLR